MALIAESFVVVARRGALEARYPGGEAAFLAAAPNSTACRDGALCSVWFMVERDAYAFMAQLESAGLRGPGEDFTMFETLMGRYLPAPWLAVTTVPLPAHDGSGDVSVRVLYLKGTEPGPVCAHSGHKIGATDWMSDDQLAAYDFVDHVSGVTTIRHRVSGELRYLGRPSSAGDCGIRKLWRV